MNINEIQNTCKYDMLDTLLISIRLSKLPTTTKRKSQRLAFSLLKHFFFVVDLNKISNKTNKKLLWPNLVNSYSDKLFTA